LSSNKDLPEQVIRDRIEQAQELNDIRALMLCGATKHLNEIPKKIKNGARPAEFAERGLIPLGGRIFLDIRKGSH
jgi:hypothetical protein